MCLFLAQVKLTKDKVLVISGEHTANNEDKGAGHSQRISRTFTRRYQLPDSTNTETISAKLQDGLLTLTVPKTNVPEVEDQEIMIQEAGSSSGGTANSAAAASVDAPHDAEAKSQGEMSTAAATPVNREASEPKSEQNTAGKEDKAGAPFKSEEAVGQRQQSA